MFTTKFGPNGLNIYNDNVFMGVVTTLGDKITFSQWSNDGYIYDKELAKQFLKEEFGLTKFKVESGMSTATQRWFKITSK